MQDHYPFKYIFKQFKIKVYTITFKSFDNLFKILPNGILSKNSVRGAYIKLFIMILWIFFEVEYENDTKVTILKNAKRDYPIESIMNQIK